MRILQQGLISGKLTLRLCKLYFKRPAVNFGEEIALMDELPFSKCHMDELATSITVHTVVAEPRRISSLEPVARRGWGS